MSLLGFDSSTIGQMQQSEFIRERKKKQQKYFIYFRHEDLKEMLDSNKDGLKLEAMKRIIGVIT